MNNNNNNNGQEVLPRIMGHSFSEGCYVLDHWLEPMLPETPEILEKQEEVAFLSDSYFEISYDNEGNSTVTKKLRKTLQNRNL